MRIICPEVVQTSAMDCGPAALTCLLQGFGVPVSYGRLREACQTDVDGTSIDTLEEVARDLGLDAEQVMVPADYLLDRAAGALPAIVVVRLPSGPTHFVVVWRRHGPFVQVMDPGAGRRWMRTESLVRDVYRHEMPVPAAGWRDWAATGQGRQVLEARLRRLGVHGGKDGGKGGGEGSDGGDREGGAIGALIGAALEDPGWRSLAALEAAVRATERLRRAGGLSAGRQAEAVVRALVARGATAIAEADWSVAPAPPAEDGTEQVRLRGAVLVRVLGRLPAEQAERLREGERGATAAPPPSGPPEAGVGEGPPPSAASPARALSPDLAAALAEPPARPGRDLLRLLRVDGALQPTFVIAGLALAAVGTVVEAVLLRRLVDLGEAVGLQSERVVIGGAIMWLLGALLLVRVPVLAGVLGMGRRLEARLRVAFLSKLPRLGDRYLASRPTSDMAERGHSMQQLRTLPLLGQQIVGTGLEILATTAGLVWLAPRAAWAAIAAAALEIALPLALQKPLAEQDLRVRAHEGSLARFYLDAMLGLLTIRTHTAERAVRREHGARLAEWRLAVRSFVRTTVVIEALQALVGVGVAAALLVTTLDGGTDPASVLLLVHWALSLPALGYELALAARQYPMLRNLTLRLVEPLGAREEREAGEIGDAEADPNAKTSRPPTGAAAAGATGPFAGVSLSLRGVVVVAGGHTVLDGVDLELPAGAHVAVVGASGAGKSTLAGLFLGWHRPRAGEILVDGRVLDGPRLARLRREAAWIDPAVQLWNRSLRDNLRYGAPGARGSGDLDDDLAAALDTAELRAVVARLPAGADAPLGEGGGLLSGGEGQRVRFGRAVLRAEARLVILDEAFRGLERARRRALTARARALWPRATLVCITHDVTDTLDFPRVLVIEGGRVVEDGPPGRLGAQPSRYRAMLDAEADLRDRVWRSSRFRRVELVDGQIRPLHDDGSAAS